MLFILGVFNFIHSFLIHKNNSLANFGNILSILKLLKITTFFITYIQITHVEYPVFSVYSPSFHGWKSFPPLERKDYSGLERKPKQNILQMKTKVVRLGEITSAPCSTKVSRIFSRVGIGWGTIPSGMVGDSL